MDREAWQTIQCMGRRESDTTERTALLLFTSLNGITLKNWKKVSPEPCLNPAVVAFIHKFIN